MVPQYSLAVNIVLAQPQNYNVRFFQPTKDMTTNIFENVTKRCQVCKGQLLKKANVLHSCRQLDTDHTILDSFVYKAPLQSTTSH